MVIDVSAMLVARTTFLVLRLILSKTLICSLPGKLPYIGRANIFIWSEEKVRICCLQGTDCKTLTITEICRNFKGLRYFLYDTKLNVHRFTQFEDNDGRKLPLKY